MKEKLEDPNQEVTSASASFHISIKCISLIKTIKEAIKRETGEA